MHCSVSVFSSSSLLESFWSVWAVGLDLTLSAFLHMWNRSQVPEHISKLPVCPWCFKFFFFFFLQWGEIVILKMVMLPNFLFFIIFQLAIREIIYIIYDRWMLAYFRILLTALKHICSFTIWSLISCSWIWLRLFFCLY